MSIFKKKIIAEREEMPIENQPVKYGYTDEEKYTMNLTKKDFCKGSIYYVEYPIFFDKTYDKTCIKGTQIGSRTSTFTIISKNSKVSVVLFFKDNQEEPVAKASFVILPNEHELFNQDKSCYEEIEIPWFALPGTIQQ